MVVGIPGLFYEFVAWVVDVIVFIGDQTGHSFMF
jgi:hypothetical protein